MLRPEPIEPDTELLLSGRIDSLGVVQIVEWIEANRSVVIEPVDVIVENFTTVEAMVDFVDRLAARTA